MSGAGIKREGTQLLSRDRQEAVVRREGDPESMERRKFPPRRVQAGRNPVTEPRGPVRWQILDKPTEP